MKLTPERKQYLWRAAAAIYVLFIFSNSMKPADLSSADSGAVLRMVQQGLALAGIDSTVVTEHMIRKTAHFTEYAVLGILLCNCFKTFVVTADRRMLSQVLVSFLVPFTDETIQLFVTGRSGQISDVWLDCAGVAFGTMVFATAVRIAGRMGVKRRDKKLQDGSSI